MRERRIVNLDRREGKMRRDGKGRDEEERKTDRSRKQKRHLESRKMNSFCLFFSPVKIGSLQCW